MLIHAWYIHTLLRDLQFCQREKQENSYLLFFVYNGTKLPSCLAVFNYSRTYIVCDERSGQF